ncbi:MAG TPA: glucose-6-phosphate isomerase, partial [Acidimicrobiaceae bacterium]|nr:glucose-6-phosphate isomerase [Acidimicrobiaceae bacterium]
MTGNRPSTFISWDKTNAESLGKLLALYENATIVCGLLWGINSFDQWGVELGKELASALTPALSDAGNDIDGDADSATVATVQWYRAHKAR